MADSSSSSNPSLPSDRISLRQLSYSFFHTSGSRLGVSAKHLPDSESVWSPTSPLDCRVFSNRSNPFSVKSSSRPSSFQTGHKKQPDSGKVGLGIISSLVNDETKLNYEILERKNIVFGPQVKTGILKFSKNSHEPVASYLKSSSLPKNYVISLPSGTQHFKPEVESFDDVETEAFTDIMTCWPDSSRPSSSLLNSSQDSFLGNSDLCVENTSTETGLPPRTGRSLQVDTSLKIQSSSLPVSIDFNGYLGSLSAREIELSEDYTCIISHGPNPKRTHIFGDYILECHKHDFTEFSKEKEEELAFRSSQDTTFSEESTPYISSNDVLSFCYLCNKKLEEGEDIFMYRGEKAFCSLICRSEEILAEEELERTCTNSAGSSPGSSYHDDLFLAGLLVPK